MELAFFEGELLLVLRLLLLDQVVHILLTCDFGRALEVWQPFVVVFLLQTKRREEGANLLDGPNLNAGNACFKAIHKFAVCPCLASSELFVFLVFQFAFDLFGGQRGFVRKLLSGLGLGFLLVIFAAFVGGFVALIVIVRIVLVLVIFVGGLFALGWVAGRLSILFWAKFCMLWLDL